MALTFLPFRFPGIPRVRCAFQILSPSSPPGDSPDDGNISLEAGGDPARALSNRESLARELGLDALAETRQVHGTRTLFEPDPVDPGKVPLLEADGMVTSRPGLGLMIKAADCQPVFLAEPSGRFVAALHVGWRGNRQNYPGLAVAEFCARCRLRPEDLSAVRGPSLGPAEAEFVHFDDEWGPEFIPWFNPASRTVDLWSLTRHQLRQAGLRPERIYSLDLCTMSLPDIFFSYRRDPRCGRQGSLIWIACRP
jgi:YfiH family protein